MWTTPRHLKFFSTLSLQTHQTNQKDNSKRDGHTRFSRTVSSTSCSLLGSFTDAAQAGSAVPIFPLLPLALQRSSSPSLPNYSLTPSLSALPTRTSKRNRLSHDSVSSTTNSFRLLENISITNSTLSLTSIRRESTTANPITSYS